MWWREFLSDLDSVYALPRDRLEAAYKSSESMLEELEAGKIEIEARVRDICQEGGELIAENESFFYDQDRLVSGGEMQRNLTFQYDDLYRTHTEIIEKIQTDKSILDRLSHNVKTNGNFNIVNKSKKLIDDTTNNLLRLASVTEDRDERYRIVLAAQIFSYRGRLLGVTLQNHKENFYRKCTDQSMTVSKLTKKAAKIIRKTQEIKDNCEYNIKTYGRPPLPGIEADLQRQIKEIGDSRNHFIEVRKKVDSLLAKRDDLNSEITDIMASDSKVSILFALDAQKNATIDIKNQLMNAQFEENELLQSSRKLQSRIRTAKDNIAEALEQKEKINEECEKIRSTIDTIKNKPELLKRDGLSDEDIAYLIEVSASGIRLEDLSILKEENRKLNRRLQSLEATHKACNETLRNYEVEIAQLEGMLATANKGKGLAK